MRLPDDLRDAIDEALASCNTALLREAGKSLSSNYRSGKGSKEAFGKTQDVLAYLATRLPATFGACASVFQAIRSRCPEFSCHAMLDLGAGPGTASFAALEVFSELAHLYLIEQEALAIEMGKKICQKSAHDACRKSVWEQRSLASNWSVPTVDLAVLSYVWNELQEDAAYGAIEKLWDKQVPLVAVIEPGTPKGFDAIRRLRAFVLEKGAFLIAPCPHEKRCPMPVNDWCHFSARIERDRRHRQLKDGSLGYEDEKYSYVVYAHPSMDLKREAIKGRVLRHPHKGKGHVRFSLCSADGLIREEVVTRSQKEEYQLAKKLEWGSFW